MTDHDFPDVAASEPDPRIIAVHRVVDLERQHQDAQQEADRRAKAAAILREELSQARDELSGLLGYPSKSSGLNATEREDVRQELLKRAYVR